MDNIFSKLINKKDTVDDFFKKKFSETPSTVYSSVDIRNAGFKISPIDSNSYPAGFNNMCEIDKENASEIFKNYIQKNYFNINKILLLTEDNTRNLFYWDNVFTIYSIIKNAGYECFISMAGFLEESEIFTSTGRLIKLSQVKIKNDKVYANQNEVDLILSNNDFTLKNDFLEKINKPVNPPYELGWLFRKKSNHLNHYHKILKEFCDLLDIDPWHFSLKTNVVSNAEPEQLAQVADKLILELKKEYLFRGITNKPFVFIKNNSGTYGMGVISVESANDILKWNNKEKSKIKRGKLGSPVTELIIQEGVPSCLTTDEGFIAEPVLYMIGDRLVGGFLRSHTKKTNTDNLNTPGSVFKKFCMTDMKIPQNGISLESVYAIVAKLCSLAISLEARELKNSETKSFNSN